VESGWQDVDEEAADELVGGEGHHLGALAAFGAVVLPLERHAGIAETRVAGPLSGVLRSHPWIKWGGRSWTRSAAECVSPGDYTRARQRAVYKAPVAYQAHWTSWGAAFGGGSTTNGDPTAVGSNNVSAHTGAFRGRLRLSRRARHDPGRGAGRRCGQLGAGGRARRRPWRHLPGGCLRV